MPDPDAPESILARAAAQLMASAGLGVYRADGSDYLPSEHPILVDVALPARTDNATAVIPLVPVREGAANVLFRVHVVTRMKTAGGLLAPLRARAAATKALFDHREYTPQILGISWAEQYSAEFFEADTQSRVTATQSFQFRGRTA